MTEFNKLYRYIDYHVAMSNGTNTCVTCETYTIMKHTPHGAWISMHHDMGGRSRGYEELKESKLLKFVVVDARIPWAHKTKELALKSFLIRKDRQLGHINRQLRNVTKAIELGKKLEISDDEILSEKSLLMFE